MAVPSIIGRYEIVGSIGSGGMGTLLRARDPKIGGRIVAIKLLKEGIDNDEIRRRFMQEANAAGVLEHENIVRIFDVGEQDGEPFIAMEYIDGETLSQWIRRREPASIVRKLKLIEDLCDGLAYAHTFNIIHRDVKPANLMVEKRRGRLKILDFGIAKLADSGITNAGALIGSFNYMSPEQVRGLPIDHRSDIFSVGAVTFELLCYKQAFPGTLGDGVLGRIAEQPTPKLRNVLPEADPEIEQIINRALEKDAARRYPDLPAMHRDLTRVRRRLERDDAGDHTHIEHEPRRQSTPAAGIPRPQVKTGPEAERLTRMRAEQVKQHLDAAHAAFEARRYDEAIEHTYRASAVDETDERPQELRSRAQAALDEAEASQHLAEAQASLARGDIDGADSFVGKAIEVRPGHPAIGPMREAVARARNQVALAATLQRARQALEHQDYTAAIRASTEAELYQPGLEEARQIRQRAQAAIDEAAARERARLERIRVAVESARRAIVHGAIEEAQRHADQAARDRADARVLESLRTEIDLARQQAESAARRSAQVVALIGEAIAKYNAGEYRAAMVRCDAALRLQPDEAQALDVRRRAHRAIEEEEERQRQAAEAERRRLADEATRQAREQHDRAAQAEIEQARREFDAGRHDAAIARLQRFAPAHEQVTHGIAALRAELVEIRAVAEAAAQAERAEAARRAADEQRRRDEEARAAAQRQAEEQRRRDEEARAEAQRQADEQRRREDEQRREAEAQRQARVGRAAALAGTARELATAGKFAEALATLTEAARLDPGNAETEALTRQVRDAKERYEAAERRVRDVAAKVAEAESRLVAGDLAKARKVLEAAAAIDAQGAGVQALGARIVEAEQRAAAERAAQQRAAEAARQAKERDQKVNALIAKARKAKKPADALKLLEEALQIDPQRTELPALISERRAQAGQQQTGPLADVRPSPQRPLVTPGVSLPAGTRSKGISPAILGAAGAFVLALVLGVWYFTRDPVPTPPPGGGKKEGPPEVVQLPSAVSIVSAPWANVTLRPVAGGNPLTCTTPCSLQLSPGEYDVSYENADLSEPLSERLVVPAGQPLDVNRKLPGFDVDQAITSILGR